MTTSPRLPRSFESTALARSVPHPGRPPRLPRPPRGHLRRPHARHEDPPPHRSLVRPHGEARATAASLSNPHPLGAPGMPRLLDGGHRLREIDVAEVVTNAITADVEEAEHDADYIDELDVATHARAPSAGCGTRA